MIINKLIVTYTDAPAPSAFSITVPPGEYTNDELRRRWFDAYEAARAAAPVRTVEIPFVSDAPVPVTLTIGTLAP